MQRYNIFGRNAIVVPAFESACPGSCEVRYEIPFDRAAVSCVATQEILRGDAGIATWRRRKRGEEGEREKVNGGMEKVNEVNEVNGEFGESDGKRIPEKGFFIKNILYNNVRA